MPLPAFLNNPQDRQILADLQAYNQKHIEPLDFDHTEAGTVKIFNVGPKEHLIPCGGLGDFLIPGCEENKPYSKPLEIWRQFPEGKNDDMQKMSLRIVDGHGIAESLVSFGKFTDPSSDLRKHGVFVCGAYVTVRFKDGTEEEILASEKKGFLMAQKKAGRACTIINTREATDVAVKAARKYGDKRKAEEISADILAGNLPTEKELEDANLRLTGWQHSLIEIADGYHRAGNFAEIQALHRWAAIKTGNSDRPWVKTVMSKGACAVCTSPLNEGQAICTGCRSVVPGMEHIVMANCVPGYERLWDPSHPAHRDYKAPAK